MVRSHKLHYIYSQTKTHLSFKWCFQVHVQPVLSILLATFAGCGVAMSGSSIIVEILRLKRRWWNDTSDQQINSQIVLRPEPRRTQTASSSSSSSNSNVLPSQDIETGNIEAHRES